MNQEKTTRRRTALLALLQGLLLSLAALAAGAQTDSGESAQEQIVGVYALAEYRAHGAEPIGRISYDEAGRMWAMLFPPGREPISNDSTPDEYRDTMRGVVAYYGSYDVDEATGRVIHHVEAASNPSWVGTDFIRWFRFENGDLRISLNPEFNNPLLWRRLPDGAAND